VIDPPLADIAAAIANGGEESVLQLEERELNVDVGAGQN
jgi:hypothetical protein